MRKPEKIGIKSFGIILASIILICLFGNNNICNLIFKKILLTPYNIVGIILTFFSIGRAYISKKESSSILKVITLFIYMFTFCSYVFIVCGWLNFDLWNWIWDNILVGPLTICLYLLLIIIALIVLIFIIWLIVILIQNWLENKDEVKYKEYSYLELISKPKKEKIEISSQEIFIDENKKIKTKEENAKKEENKIINTISIIEDEFDRTKYEEDISNNICPECGNYLTKRTNPKTGESFRGCTNYRRKNCRFTISDKRYLEIYKKYH